MTELALTAVEQAMLAGSEGPATAMAMRIVTGLAKISGADRLIEVSSAHIDSCLYHGIAGLDFAERLAADGGRVRVPTTLNVSSLDLLHPGLVHGDEEVTVNGRKLMEAYLRMGARATWTCAPYQLQQRPSFGEDIAWAESNAIVFANSVLGARSDRYGDFLDIAAAITGRAPRAGLHLTENRRGQVVFDLTAISEALRADDVFYPVLGHLVGRRVGVRIPVLVGLSNSSEDQLKAFGAAAASAGGVALFHAVGVTPEAPTLEAALQGRPPIETIQLGSADMIAARDELSTVSSGRIDVISVGTPHFSLREIRRAATLLEGRSIDPTITFYISTARDLLAAAEADGSAATCRQSGVTFVVDTCTYVTPILKAGVRTAMTNSGKWAYYAPGNMGIDVVFGSLEDCVETACSGKLVRNDSQWLGA